MLDITTGFAHTVQSWAFLGPGELSVWRASADGKPRRPSHYEVHHARRGGWAKCTPVCKQQIDGLICHLVWRETSFIFWGGGGSTFPIQMNRSISAPLLGPSPPASGVKRERRKKSAQPPFSHSFFFPPRLISSPRSSLFRSH